MTKFVFFLKPSIRRFQLGVGGVPLALAVAQQHRGTVAPFSVHMQRGSALRESLAVDSGRDTSHW